MKTSHTVRWAWSLCLSAVLSACSGGGSGAAAAAGQSGGSTAVPQWLTGVAAIGKPLAGAQITLRDADGVTRSGSADAAGHFSLDRQGLQPPMLLEAVSNDIRVYAPVFAGDSHVNANQFTSVQLRQLLQQQCGSDACRSAVQTLPLGTPLFAGQVSLGGLTAAGFDEDMRLLGLAAGVGSNSSTLRTDQAFRADGTGWDAVLDAHPYATLAVSAQGISSAGQLLQAPLTTLNLADAPALFQPDVSFATYCRGSLSSKVYRASGVDVYGQASSEALLRETAMLAAAYRAKELARFGVDAANQPRMQVCVDSSQQAGTSGNGLAWAGHYVYVSGVGSDGPAEWRRTLQHEIIHAVVNAATGNTSATYAGGPRMVETWFNEGLALHFAGQDDWLLASDDWFADTHGHPLHPMDVSTQGMVNGRLGSEMGYYPMYRMIMRQLQHANGGPVNFEQKVRKVLQVVAGKPLAEQPDTFRQAVASELFGGVAYATYRQQLPAKLRDFVADTTLPLAYGGGELAGVFRLPAGSTADCATLMHSSEEAQIVNGKILLPKASGSQLLFLLQSEETVGGQQRLQYYPLQTVNVQGDVLTPAVLDLAGQTTASLSCSA